MDGQVEGWAPHIAKVQRTHQLLAFVPYGCTTYLPPPAMRCGWRLRPGSCAPRTRRRPHLVCSASHERFAGRRASRWAGWCDGIGDPLVPSPRVRHLCTTPGWVSAVPLPCSWVWPARLWTQSSLTGVRWSSAPHPLIWAGILLTSKVEILLT